MGMGVNAYDQAGAGLGAQQIGSNFVGGQQTRMANDMAQQAQELEQTRYDAQLELAGAAQGAAARDRIAELSSGYGQTRSALESASFLQDITSKFSPSDLSRLSGTAQGRKLAGEASMAGLSLFPLMQSMIEPKTSTLREGERALFESYLQDPSSFTDAIMKGDEKALGTLRALQEEAQRQLKSKYGAYSEGTRAELDRLNPSDPRKNRFTLNPELVNSYRQAEAGGGLPGGGPYAPEVIDAVTKPGTLEFLHRAGNPYGQ
jgi:hypothetical protein